MKSLIKESYGPSDVLDFCKKKGIEVLKFYDMNSIAIRVWVIADQNDIPICNTLTLKGADAILDTINKYNAMLNDDGKPKKFKELKGSKEYSAKQLLGLNL